MIRGNACVMGASLRGYYKDGLPWKILALMEGTGSTCYVTVGCHHSLCHHAQVAALPWALEFPQVSLSHHPRPDKGGCRLLPQESILLRPGHWGQVFREKGVNAGGSEHPPSERWAPRIPLKTQHSDPGLHWQDDRWQSFTLALMPK